MTSEIVTRLRQNQSVHNAYLSAAWSNAKKLKPMSAYLNKRPMTKEELGSRNGILKLFG